MSALVFVIAALGSALMAVAALGLLRMPDFATRMHASSKAGTLGASLVLIAAAVHFGEASIGVRTLLVGLFLLLTAPVASHVIARAAYRIGVQLSPETVVDELAEAVRLEDRRDAGDNAAPAGPAEVP
jgi:multicomponent Na+:H+ antiporter subunit G